MTMKLCSVSNGVQSFERGTVTVARQGFCVVGRNWSFYNRTRLHRGEARCIIGNLKKKKNTSYLRGFKN